MTQSRQKYVFWLPTGGFTHMMCSLSSCMKYALASGRKLIPLTEKHDIIGTTFYEFYRLLTPPSEGTLASTLASPEDEAWARDNYVPPDFSLPSQIDKTLISGHLPDSKGRHRYIINDIMSVGTNEWYLEPSSSASWNEKQFVLSWGHFDQYWPSMLQDVFTDIFFQRHIQESILQQLNSALSTTGPRFLAVHFRNTDYKSSFENVSSEALEYCISNSIDSIYWATDDIHSITRAYLFFKKHAIYVINKTLTIDVSAIPGADALHALPIDYLREAELNQSYLTIQFLVDVFLCASGSHFIGANGTVPFLIQTFRQNNKELLKKHMLY